MKRLLIAGMAALMTMMSVACQGSEKAIEDVKNIKEKGELVVGITDFEPLDYQDDTGEWTGFDAELARAFGASLGVEVKLQEINWATKENELNGLTIDVIWNGLTYDKERAENMALSTAYLVNQQVVVTNREKDAAWTKLDDLKAASIAIESGSAGETVLKDALPDAKVVDKTSQIEALTELAMGTVDAVVIDQIMANYLVNKADSQFKDLVVRDDLIASEEEDYVVALRKGSDMQDDLNAFLKKAKEDGTLEELAEKYGLTAALK